MKETKILIGTSVDNPIAQVLEEISNEVYDSGVGSKTKINITNKNIIDLNIVVLGNTYSGKTTMIHKYVNVPSRPLGNVTATIAVDFFRKYIEYDSNNVININIQDTSGNENYTKLLSSFIRKAHGVIVVCDIKNQKSLLDTKKWVDIVIENKWNTSTKIPVSIVANKCDADMTKHNNIDALKTIENMYKDYNDSDIIDCFFGYQCSSLSPTDNTTPINEIFEHIVYYILESKQSLSILK